jgi:nitrate reductase gamma subunit
MSNWYNNLPEHTKTYLESQPIYYGSDIFKASIWGVVIGFIIGLLVGFEWAYQPVITVFRPLVG